MIQRVIRRAETFEEARAFDREDLARLTLEERISAVETLRRIWFGEDRAQSGLVRVLIALDRKRSSVPPRRPGAKKRRPRAAK